MGNRKKKPVNLGALINALKDKGVGGDKQGLPLKPPNTGARQPPPKIVVPRPGPKPIMPKPAPKPAPKPFSDLPPGLNPANVKGVVEYNRPGAQLLNNTQAQGNPYKVLYEREKAQAELQASIETAQAEAGAEGAVVNPDGQDSFDVQQWVKDNTTLLIVAGVAVFVLTRS